MLVIAKSDLFHVLYQKPKLWVIVLFAYAMFSVYPQELIYRTLYFQRYRSLFKSKSLFVFLNAIVFSLGHIFYRNPLVLLMTFLGGILFALTYEKTKSTLLVSIEHAIYGCWLFTVGMGSMLGFPDWDQWARCPFKLSKNGRWLFVKGQSKSYFCTQF